MYIRRTLLACISLVFLLFFFSPITKNEIFAQTLPLDCARGNGGYALGSCTGSQDIQKGTDCLKDQTGIECCNFLAREFDKQATCQDACGNPTDTRPYCPIAQGGTCGRSTCGPTHFFCCSYSDIPTPTPVPPTPTPIPGVQATQQQCNSTGTAWVDITNVCVAVSSCTNACQAAGGTCIPSYPCNPLVILG